MALHDVHVDTRHSCHKHDEAILDAIKNAAVLRLANYQNAGDARGDFLSLLAKKEYRGKFFSVDHAASAKQAAH